jgi:hypothetical protein
MAQEASETPKTIHVPAPTSYPLILGFGITFLFAGIVTFWYVSLTGAILALFGIVGLWRGVLPHEKEIEIPIVTPPVPQPPGANQKPPSLGEDRHRMRIPVEMHPYSSGIMGGLLGGLAMAIVALVWGLIQGSIWYPINLLAAIAMTNLTADGGEALRQFHIGAFIIAVCVHVIMSVLIGLLYAVILPMMPRRPILMGGIIAPILWTGLLWSIMHVVNPALDRDVSWPWFFASQIAFGIVVGIWVARTEKVKTLQSEPFSARAGIDSAKKGGE